MKTSFAAPSVAEETQTETLAPAAPEPQKSLATLSSDGPNVTGDIDISDIKLPRVNLVQKSGKLGDTFAPGSFLLAREVLLSKLDTTFNIIVLNLKKQYQQDLKYDENGPSPLIFNTAEEVRGAGGSVRYGDEGYYKEIATILGLVEAPEGINQESIDSYFYYQAEEKNYCLALWTLAGSAYNHAGKKFITAGTYGHLKDGFRKGVWAVGAEKKVYAGNTYYVPTPKPSGLTTPAFQEWAKALLSR